MSEPRYSNDAKETEAYGYGTVVLGYGTGRENESVIHRFPNHVGNPDVLTAGH